MVIILKIIVKTDYKCYTLVVYIINVVKNLIIIKETKILMKSFQSRTNSDNSEEEDINMNKTELTAAMAGKLDKPKKEVEEFLNAFTDTITETLKEGDKIQITGFGTFETRERAARQGRNPKKPDEIIEIPATVAPVFKAGTTLKNSIKK